MISSYKTEESFTFSPVQHGEKGCELLNHEGEILDEIIWLKSRRKMSTIPCCNSKNNPFLLIIIRIVEIWPCIGI